MVSRLYNELADWWPLLSPLEEYADEAVFYGDQLVANCDFAPFTVLELGAGGGNNACFMKRRFEMTLVDLSPAMLEVSRRVNPECRHLPGDMRSLRLGEEFDAVFVHDAASFLVTEADLLAALQTARLHLRPGGAALFAPDYTAESFAPATGHGGCDGDDGRGLRYLEWSWDPDPTDHAYLCDFALLLRQPSGEVTVEHDRYELGCLPRATWLGAMGEVGFEATSVPSEYARSLGYGGDLFVGRRR